MVLEGADLFVWADFSQVLPQIISNAPNGADLGLNIKDILNSLGLDGFKSMAAVFKEQNDGAHFDFFIVNFSALYVWNLIQSAPAPIKDLADSFVATFPAII